MLRRNLRRMRRYPSMTLILIGIPVILLLLFVYVFGGTIGAGLGGVSGGRAEYANYVVPGILLISIASGATGTAVSVAMDMTEGIIARFKTMAIFRPSVLTGHVIGSVIQTVISLALSSGSRCSSASGPPRTRSSGWPPQESSSRSPMRSPGCRSRSASRPRPSKAPATCPCR